MHRYPSIPRSVMTGLAFVVLGVSVYLIIPIRACFGPDVDWGHAVNLKQFIWVLMRGAYTDIEMEVRPWSSFAAKIAEWEKSVAVHWWPGWLLLAGLGLAGLWKASRGLARGLMLLYFPVVAAVLVVPNLTEDTSFLVQAYLVSTQGLLALFGFCGMCWLFSLVRSPAWWRRAVPLVLLLGAGAGWMARTFLHEEKTDYAIANDFGLNILQGLPRGSLILSEGDQFVMTLFYYQSAEGKRRDVVNVPSIFLNSDWGFERALFQLSGRVKLGFPILEPRERLRFLLAASGASGDPASLRTFYSLNRGLLDKFDLKMDEQLAPVGLVYEAVRGPAPKAEEIARQVWDAAQRQRLRHFESLRSKDQVDDATAEFYRYYANQYVVAGNTLNHSGNLALALEYYLEALSVYPFTGEAYSNLAVLYGKEGFLEMAQVLCQMAIEQNPDYAGAYDNLGNVFTLMGSYSRAVEAYRRALTLKPDDANTRENLGQADGKLRSKAPPPNWVLHPSTYYFAMGNQSASAGRLLMAEIAYRTAESVGYTYPDIYNNLGVVLAQLGRERDAEKTFLKAIDRKEDFVEVYKNYGLLLVNQKRVREARQIIGKGLKLSPDNPELLALQSMIH